MIRSRRLARNLALSLRLLAAHRIRTALSVSGLLVGVTAVMIMAAVGAGAERRLLDRVRAMGTDLLVVRAAPAPAMAGRRRDAETVTILRPDDAIALLEESPRAMRAAPGVSRAQVARWEGRNVTLLMQGTTPEGLHIQNVRAAAGRLYDETEERERRRVAVVGATVVRTLFGGRDPIGQEVRLGSIPFDVVGVIAPRGTDAAGGDLDNVVFIPLETAMRRVLSIPFVHALFFQARSSADLGDLERDIRATLARLHPARSGMPEPFTIQNQAVLLRTERGVAGQMNRLVVGVSLLALVVGGVGILAVMLLSVRDRVPEIGLRRAVGARRVDIQVQFLLEAVLLAGAGGAVGVLLGLVSSAALALLSPWDLVLPWRAAAIGVVMSALLGAAAGAVPAARAASLEPAEALRGT